VSARTALHIARGELDLKRPFVVESILGSCFTGEGVERTTFGAYEAIVPKVTGMAYITGINKLLIDPTDPHRNGFIL